MKPRAYQAETLEKTWNYLKQNPSGRPVIVWPTGAGKSWEIAMLCQKAAEHGGRVLIVAHRKELLQQNAEKISTLIGENVGYYSAGLRSWDTDSDFVVAGIQSIHRDPGKMGVRNLIIIDEAHLINNNASSQSMYQKLLQAYPEARVIGLTATPYRTGEGPIYGKGRTFDVITYEAKVSDLINDGYLSPLTRTPTSTVDVSRVRVRAGEFIAGQMEAAFNDDQTVQSACEEIVSLTPDRKSVLVFCCGVAHCHNVQDKLEKLTREDIGCVTGDTGPLERQTQLRRFQQGITRFMVNCDVLTTGFDSPRIDCVAVLRSTMSPGLFMQMVGRGFRVHEGKDDCLLLDFGGNRKRHGEPDRDDYGYLVEDGDQDDGHKVPESNTRGRICANCEGDIPPGTIVCPHCLFEPVGTPRPESNHLAQADLEPVESEVDWEVEEVSYNKHTKRKGDDIKPPTLRVTYHVRRMGAGEGNLRSDLVREWVCFEHNGFAFQKAIQWWRLRSDHPMPESVDEAIDMISRHAVRAPYKIITRKEGQWRRVETVNFKDKRPEIEILHSAEVIPEGAGWSDDYVPF